MIATDAFDFVQEPETGGTFIEAAPHRPFHAGLDA